MTEELKQSENPWMNEVEQPSRIAHFSERALVNPLDVVKIRLQAQAAGIPYSHPLSNFTSRMSFFGPHMMFADLRCCPSCTRAGVHGTVSICPPDCFHYKGTLAVFYKIVRQEGVSALWRGTNAGLALAVPTVGIYLPCYDIFGHRLEELTAHNAPGLTPYVPLVAGSLARSLACISCYPIELARTRMQTFKHGHGDLRPPGVWRTLADIISKVKGTTSFNSTLPSYRFLWTGLGAQLARDVPFSAICWSTLEPVRRRLLGLVGDEANAVSVFAANVSGGFVARSLAAAATCPLDVAKTCRQIEKDPSRALWMTTRHTLLEIWRYVSVGDDSRYFASYSGISGDITGVFDFDFARNLLQYLLQYLLQICSISAPVSAHVSVPI